MQTGEISDAMSYKQKDKECMFDHTRRLQLSREVETLNIGGPPILKNMRKSNHPMIEKVVRSKGSHCFCAEPLMTIH